ncbi:MAG: hypothetical protein PHW63_08975 [Alphaproteobacteria bacterium]|nr:hypothetical protein [Alphaproteobacteria bacterium]
MSEEEKKIKRLQQAVAEFAAFVPAGVFSRVTTKFLKDGDMR